MSFLTLEQINELQFKSCGTNVKISERAVFYNTSQISIGDNSRIDDFVIISAGFGGIQIGKFVHIAAYCSLQGNSEIILEDFSGLSSRVSIYSSSDDYSGKKMTNPTVDSMFTGVYSAPVTIKKHSIIGVNASILPGVTIGFASAIGAFSLVTKDIGDHKIAVGVPAKEKILRKKDLLDLEVDFLRFKNNSI